MVRKENHNFLRIGIIVYFNCGTKAFTLTGHERILLGGLRIKELEIAGCPEVETIKKKE